MSADKQERGGLSDGDRLWREAIAFSGIGTLRYVFDGTVRFMDANAFAILGLDARFPDPSAVVGRKIGDLIVYLGPEQWLRNSLRAQNEVRNLETHFRTPSGEERWVQIDAYVTRDDAGGEPVLQVIGRDITALKKAEQALRHSEEERARFEHQMLQTQKMESLGVLAGGIAHDFNNLLMTVLGNAEMAALELPPNSPVCANLDEIKSASLRAADLCKQMLAYSGRGRFVVEPLDLSGLVREMTHMLKVSVSKKVRLSLRLADGLPPIDGDAEQLRQAVVNLVTNASEAIGDAGGAVLVSTGLLECDGEAAGRDCIGGAPPAGRYVFLRVEDTGCGMNAETQAKIFEPFFSTKFTGRGLGLAAVLGIARGHRGSVSVESAPGQGSAFRLLLPVSARTALAPPPPASAAGSARGAILIVDDEPSVLELARVMVQHCGFRAFTACDGWEAMQLYRVKSADIVCVLLDLTMPRMDGEETLRELRRIRSDVRVLLSSGYSGPEVRRRFAGQGLAGFLEKPYQLEALADKLREVCGTAT